MGDEFISQNPRLDRLEEKEGLNRFEKTEFFIA